ncbi:Adenylate kinase 7 [Lobulomyces angularis]|nr:Adenylate kinase 7 [Lobulomyces angularis]
MTLAKFIEIHLSMKVFISNVDAPYGHHLSRIFHSSPVNNRKEEDEEREEDAPPPPETNAENQPPPEKPKESYIVTGTLTKQKENSEQVINLHASVPGPMVYTGDKKKDAARKEAIEKFSVLGQKPAWVDNAVDSDDKAKLKEELLDSNIIIYDLLKNLDEAVWAIETLSEASDTFIGKPKVFILVSTVMTWARTKMEQDDSEAFLSEDEYRRRKPHPNFKAHIAAEKTVMKVGKKSALKTYVVASGLIYHSGDSIFHYLLKSAWHNQDSLVCYGDGNNILPTIHVDDLVNILFELSETQPENRYLLAVDDSKLTQYEITKAISEALGTGKVTKVSKEAALLNKQLTQCEYDMLLVNLRLEPGHAKEMSFEWKYESGIIENLGILIQEYKDARGLQPLKIIIHGPPGVGKTPLSIKLAQHYDIHRVDVEKVFTEAMARLERHAAMANIPQAEGENVDEGEGDIEADKELFEEIQEAIRANTNSNSQNLTLMQKVPQDYLINFVKEKLKSMPSRNQGFVLDGYPLTFEQAVQLFKSTESEEDKNNLNPMDPLIAPEFVISLEMPDEVIKERNMNLPESVVAGTKYAEDVLTKRLEEFRSLNHDENTVLNYFDEHEVHPIIVNFEQILNACGQSNQPQQNQSNQQNLQQQQQSIQQGQQTTQQQTPSQNNNAPSNTGIANNNIESGNSSVMGNIMEGIEKVLKFVSEKVGPPRNYGPTVEQLKEKKRKMEEILMMENALAEEERVRKEKEEMEKHNKSVAEWNLRLEEVRKQEQEVLEAQSVPLRNYLMKHVMPTLTSGLIDVCKVRPDDPIDYLSEFLFKVRKK